jgi:hypothetical protein
MGGLCTCKRSCSVAWAPEGEARQQVCCNYFSAPLRIKGCWVREVSRRFWRAGSWRKNQCYSPHTGNYELWMMNDERPQPPLFRTIGTNQPPPLPATKPGQGIPISDRFQTGFRPVSYRF